MILEFTLAEVELLQKAVTNLKRNYKEAIEYQETIFLRSAIHGLTEIARYLSAEKTRNLNHKERKQ